MLLCLHDNLLLQLCFVSVIRLEDGIKSVCAMMCLEEAIEVFTRSLPSELELETFREEVYKSLDEQDPGRFFFSLCVYRWNNVNN